MVKHFIRKKAECLSNKKIWNFTTPEASKIEAKAEETVEVPEPEEIKPRARKKKVAEEE